MMDWYGNGMGTGGWVAMVTVMTIFWGLVILAGVMIFRNGGSRSLGGTRDGGTRDGGTRDRNASEILDERFARGEIEVEEYEARKAVLRGSTR